MTAANISKAALWNEIQKQLSLLSAHAPGLKSKATVPKLYEIFVFSCIARALRSIGATLVAKDSNDNPTTTLRFRLAPGLVYSPTTASGFVEITRKKQKYELHGGVRVKGRSRVRHELDVCIINRNAAVSCRKNRKDPSSTQVKMLGECKFLGKPTFPLELGREFVGLGAEFHLRIKTIVSNASNDEVHDLIIKHKGTENFGISAQPKAKIDLFVKWLANELRQVL
jgi:hypothetical protein